MLKESEVLPHEKSDQDIQWTRIVELELVPHTSTAPRDRGDGLRHGRRHGEDEAPGSDRRLHLAEMERDCSANHSLHAGGYRLWLKDHLALYGVRTPCWLQGMRLWMRPARERIVTKQWISLPAPVASAEQTNDEI